MPAEIPSITVTFDEIKDQIFDSFRTQQREEEARRWRAESNYAGTRHELAEYQARIARLLSQHEPVSKLGIDREKLRVLLRYVEHGDSARMERDLASLEKKS